MSEILSSVSSFALLPVLAMITGGIVAAFRPPGAKLRSILQHFAADAVVSLGVVLTGVVIAYTGWWMLDPTVSLVISVVIVWGTWSLLRSCLKTQFYAEARTK